MKHLNSQAIVLNRTNFGEADRILTFLTPEQGKVRVLARGVRKVKSKLAGGIELFSVSDISYLVGRGEIFTLTSSRLVKHFDNIVKDSGRTTAAYDFLKQIDKNTAEHPEPAYFALLQDTFTALDDHAVSLELIQLWFSAQMLKLAGHTPNLRTDNTGQPLDPAKKYGFDYNAMSPKPGRTLGVNEIKFLRLAFGDIKPSALGRVGAFDSLVQRCQPVVAAMWARL